MIIKCFNVVLIDGQIIKIFADKVEWNTKTRVVSLIRKGQVEESCVVVAQINMDNVVGLIEAESMESEV